MSSHRNLREALINGIIAVRSVLIAETLTSDEEISSAVVKIRRQARIAAHYARAHLNQGGQTLPPMTQAAKELFIGLLQARIYGTPRSLKSIAGGRRSRPPMKARPAAIEARKAKDDELADALDKIIRGASQLKSCVREPTISAELADALESIIRGARLFGGSNARPRRPY